MATRGLATVAGRGSNAHTERRPGTPARPHRTKTSLLSRGGLGCVGARSELALRSRLPSIPEVNDLLSVRSGVRGSGAKMLIVTHVAVVTHGGAFLRLSV